MEFVSFFFFLEVSKSCNGYGYGYGGFRQRPPESECSEQIIRKCNGYGRGPLSHNVLRRLLGSAKWLCQKDRDRETETVIDVCIIPQKVINSLWD